MGKNKDTDLVWKRPLGCLLWLLVFILIAPFLFDIFAFLYVEYFLD